jgi:hypothetical protein
MDKSTVPKLVKNWFGPTPQIQKTPIYKQIVSPAGPKKVPKMELKNGTKIVRKTCQKRQPICRAPINESLLLLAKQMLRQVRQRGIPATGL